MKYSPEMLAYAAGILDGEGCITIEALSKETLEYRQKLRAKLKTAKVAV